LAISPASHGIAAANALRCQSCIQGAQASNKPASTRYAATRKRVMARISDSGDQLGAIVSNSDGGLNERRCAGEYP
jgi:hypothetical protein